MATNSKFSCLYCKKGYKNNANFNKHTILCELIHTSKRKKELLIEDEEDDNLPSQKQMYKMLLELAFKYNKLEEKMDLAMKWIDKKKKKINILDWLNSNVMPDCVFDNLSLHIQIINQDIEFLLNNSFIDTLNELFSKSLYKNDEQNINPVFAFVQKTNTIYVFNNLNSSENPGWIELSREKLIHFMNKIHFKIVKALSEWKKQNQHIIDESERMSDLYNTTLTKLMAIDFKQENTLSKIRTSMYNKMKTDMKALIEYEFEF
jgi:hypothetical protein